MMNIEKPLLALQAWICNKLIARSATMRYAHLQVPADFQAYNYSMAPRILEDFPGLSIEGKTMLDLGCGDGGKTVYFALHGATRSDGVDLNPEKIKLAQAFAKQKGCEDKANFSLTSGNKLSYPNNFFDLIISSSVFEHIDFPDLLPVLTEAHRVLKPGGQLLLRFHPYRSRFGAHLATHIPIPWCQLLFSHQVLLDIFKDRYFKKIAAQDDGLYDPATVHAAKHVRDIAHLNLLTIREFEKVLSESPLQIEKAYPNNQGIERYLARLPVIREYLSNHAIYVLTRPS